MTAPTPGGRIGDITPLGKGKRKLSDYERQVAHALMRRGIPKERAIPMARGIIDRAATTGRWGRGKKASPNVVAGAVASVAQRKAFSVAHKLSNEEGATISGMTVDLAILNKAKRDALDADQFAIPETRSYPIPDLLHARLALAMVKMHGTPEQQAMVSAAVKKKFPQISLSNEIHELILAEAVERGLIDLGRDGAKWKHGWIPMNGIAASIKAKKFHGGKNAPSGKSRINVGVQAEHALAPKGKARETAAQRARKEAARRAEVMRQGKASDAEAIAQGHRAYTPERGKAAAAALQEAHNRAAEIQRLAALAPTKQNLAKETRRDLQKRMAMTHPSSPGHQAAKAELARRDANGETISSDVAKAKKAYEQSAPHRAALAKATAEHQRRNEDTPGKVVLKGNESYNLTTGQRVETHSNSSLSSREGADRQHELLSKAIKEHEARFRASAAEPERQGQLKRGEMVTNSAGQHLRVISHKGDNVSVRFPSGITAQVSRGSVKRETPEETAARLGMTFPKPTVKSHGLVGEGTTVENPRAVTGSAGGELSDSEVSALHDEKARLAREGGNETTASEIQSVADRVKASDPESVSAKKGDYAVISGFSTHTNADYSRTHTEQHTLVRVARVDDKGIATHFDTGPNTRVRPTHEFTSMRAATEGKRASVSVVSQNKVNADTIGNSLGRTFKTKAEARDFVAGHLGSTPKRRVTIPPGTKIEKDTGGSTPWRLTHESTGANVGRARTKTDLENLATHLHDSGTDFTGDREATIASMKEHLTDSHRSMLGIARQGGRIEPARETHVEPPKKPKPVRTSDSGGHGDLSKRTDSELQYLHHGSSGGARVGTAAELRRRGYTYDAAQGKWSKPRSAATERAQQAAQDRHRANEAKRVGAQERAELEGRSTADLMRQLNSPKTPSALKAIIQAILELRRRKQR